MKRLLAVLCVFTIALSACAAPTPQVVEKVTKETVVVEAATSLANPVWVPLRTNTLIGGSAYFSDARWTSYPRRFYRIRSP